MFQNTASFPGIAKGEKNNLRMLYVSDILQKSGLNFDEEGSAAFAATGIEINFIILKVSLKQDREIYIFLMKLIPADGWF